MESYIKQNEFCVFPTIFVTGEFDFAYNNLKYDDFSSLFIT